MSEIASIGLCKRNQRHFSFQHSWGGLGTLSSNVSLPPLLFLIVSLRLSIPVPPAALELTIFCWSPGENNLGFLSSFLVIRNVELVLFHTADLYPQYSYYFSVWYWICPNCTCWPRPSKILLSHLPHKGEVILVLWDLGQIDTYKSLEDWTVLSVLKCGFEVWKR